MAQAWALMQFTDSSGKHEPGEKLDLPRNTDAEKAEFDRLVDYEIVTTTEPKPGDTGSGEGGSARRRSQT